jgi:hypothetical protein
MAGFTIILSELKDFVKLLFSPQRGPVLFITRGAGVPGSAILPVCICDPEG